jgi:hypothetical protein
MPTWEIIGEQSKGNHALVMTFRETDDDGRRYVYRIALGPNARKEDFLAALKEKVEDERKKRKRVKDVKASIDVTKIEQFIGGDE